MSYIFLNNKIINDSEAKISIHDRALQFSDGIYEVILLNSGNFIDLDAHIERLFSSLAMLKIKLSFNKEELIEKIINYQIKTKEHNNALYIQITRGSYKRVQTLDIASEANIIMYFLDNKSLDKQDILNGFSAITHDDIRWKKCEIKSTSILANLLCKEKANELSACEAILIEDNHVTEGSFSNIFIIDKNNILITRPIDDGRILPGITRARILKLAEQNNINIDIRKYSKAELFSAKEVFASSSTMLIRPIIKIDEEIIGSGKTGDLTKKLISLYQDFLDKH